MSKIHVRQIPERIAGGSYRSLLNLLFSATLPSRNRRKIAYSRARSLSHNLADLALTIALVAALFVSPKTAYADNSAPSAIAIQSAAGMDKMCATGDSITVRARLLQSSVGANGDIRKNSKSRVWGIRGCCELRRGACTAVRDSSAWTKRVRKWSTTANDEGGVRRRPCRTRWKTSSGLSDHAAEARGRMAVHPGTQGEVRLRAQTDASRAAARQARKSKAADFVSGARPNGHPEQAQAWMLYGEPPSQCRRRGETPRFEAMPK